MGNSKSKKIQIEMKLRSGREYVYPEPETVLDNVQMGGESSSSNFGEPSASTSPSNRQQMIAVNAANMRNEIGLNVSRRMMQQQLIADSAANVQSNIGLSVYWSMLHRYLDRYELERRTSGSGSLTISIIRWICISLGVFGGLHALVDLFTEPDVIVHEVHLKSAGNWIFNRIFKSTENN